MGITPVRIESQEECGGYALARPRDRERERGDAFLIPSLLMNSQEALGIIHNTSTPWRRAEFVRGQVGYGKAPFSNTDPRKVEKKTIPALNFSALPDRVRQTTVCNHAVIAVARGRARPPVPNETHTTDSGGGGGGRPFLGRAGSAVEREAMSGMNTFTQYDNSMAEFWKQCVPGVPGTSLPG